MDFPNPNPKYFGSSSNSSSSSSWFAGNWEGSSPSQAQLQVSDYDQMMIDDDGFELQEPPLSSQSCSLTSTDQKISELPPFTTDQLLSSCATSTMEMGKAEVGQRVAFRMRSQLEVIDDGYKWRKYGKKSVKNNLNPRNYYKCSVGGCCVKKTVERDRHDSSYVITTYQGVHHHDTTTASLYRNKSRSR